MDAASLGGDNREKTGHKIAGVGDQRLSIVTAIPKTTTTKDKVPKERDSQPFHIKFPIIKPPRSLSKHTAVPRFTIPLQETVEYIFRQFFASPIYIFPSSISHHKTPLTAFGAFLSYIDRFTVLLSWGGGGGGGQHTIPSSCPKLGGLNGSHSHSSS